jgi:hypothetical protein
MAEKRPSRLRREVEIRAGGRCEYCRAPQAVCGYCFHLEHIVPRAAGGSNGLENRALACAACNLAKGDRTSGVDPESKRTVSLFDPRAHAWGEHFRFDDDSPIIMGRTPQGRATITVINLNQKLQLDARELWLAAGLLP